MAAADQKRHDSAVRPRSYQDESYQHGFLGAVGDLQKAEVLQDVVLEVEGCQFPCHRLVLSAASHYFRAMFTSGMAESRQNTVVLQGLDACVFGEILSYIYSGTLHVSLDKVQPLYQAADLLQLDYVRDTCSSYMAMNVHRSTCVDLYKFADVFSMDSVRNQCLKCIYRHFSKVASSEEFCSLSVNQLTEIISHDELDVKEETTVWEAVVRWVQHSRKDRLHHLPSILPHIRFNLLTSDDTAAILEHPLVREDPGKSAIRNVVKETSNMKKRVRMDTLEMAMLIPYNTNDILFMNPRTGKYIRSSIPEELNVLALTVTSDNNIYILANERLDNYKVFEYSQAGDVWERAHMSSVARDEKLYLGDTKILVEVDRILYFLTVKTRIGNRLKLIQGNRLVQVRKYNWHIDQWQECSQLPLDSTYREFTIASCGLHLYFITNTEMHHYDPSQDRWCKLTPPELIPEVCTAVAMGTEIFCTDRCFTKTMVYDTESDCWQVLPGWPHQEDHLAGDPPPSLFVLENQLHIHVFTYVDQDKKAKGTAADHIFVFVYDKSANVWKELKVTLPYQPYMSHPPLCPVARMYLPSLNA
ncbi:kelch repeat and BTB domain-containing protein 12-like isoform X2 [Branchiostoma lanceolatum]|uniref:kelch repeat and BTB domain-containing protein 12-like isoform X2 n=1 Tax=Branchiostoma lanceolatum TaxID=7740 RepID=UPI003452DA35